MIRIFNPGDRVFKSAGIVAIETLSLFENKKKSLNGWHIDVEVSSKYETDIAQDMIAVVQTKSKLEPQAFRIGNIKKVNSRISFRAEHVMFDARDYFLVDVRPTSMGSAAALKYVNDRTDRLSPFIVTSNVSNTQTAYFSNRNLLEAWAVIEERWGGVFDANNFNISFNTRVGNDNGETLNYGRDLEGVEVIEDWSNVVTRLYPKGPDGIMLPQQYIDSSITYPTHYVRAVSFDSKLEGEPTEQEILDELLVNATEYLENNDTPQVSYKIKSDVKGNLDIGDTVHVKHPLVEIKTEVQEYTYDMVNRRVKTLVFGNFNRDVKKKFDAIKDEIKKAKEEASKATWLVDHQANIINNLNKNGLVYIDENEILILDKLPKEQAVNVWRWGLGGFGFSKNGYEGPFDAAFTYDGFLNANFIKAGTINTNHLHADVGSSLDLSSNTSLNLIVEKIETTPGPQGPKGDKGAQGIPGVKGENGIQYYTWLKFSDTPQTGMSDSPEGKRYMGLAMNKTSPIMSTKHEDYVWTDTQGLQGQQGVPGAPGEDGKPTYTWIKWADTPTSGMSDDATNKMYVGMAHNKTTEIESSNYEDYTWSVMPQNIIIGGRNYLLKSGVETNLNEQAVIPTLSNGNFDVEGNVGGRNWQINSGRELRVTGSVYLSNQAENQQTIIKLLNENLGGVVRLSADIIEPTFTNTTGNKRIGYESYCRRVDGSPVYYGVWSDTWQEKINGRYYVTRQIGNVPFDYSAGSSIYCQGTIEGDALVTNVKFEIGEFTDYSPAYEDFKNLKGKRYDLSVPLKKDQHYTLTLDGVLSEGDFVGLWLGSDKFVGFLNDSKITFKCEEDYNDDFIILKSLSEEGTINTSNINQSNISVDWSPAPEDIQGELDDNKNKIESVEKTTKENTSKISLNSLGIQQEINDRTLMGERIIQETNLLVDAKSTQWGLEFTRLETGASETEASLQELKAYYRYTAEEALIGKSGDPMQFYFSNDEAGFRENGDRLSYWKGKKFYVQDLHVLSSIIIGQHLVESKGDVTIFRSVV